MVLEAGIFLSHWIWLLRQKIHKRKAGDEEEGTEGGNKSQTAGDEVPKEPQATPTTDGAEEAGSAPAAGQT
jgi:hypothetical protein